MKRRQNTFSEKLIRETYREEGDRRCIQAILIIETLQNRRRYLSIVHMAAKLENILHAIRRFLFSVKLLIT